ncbi:RES domain-containing protein [Vibrio cholerae]|uniref:RES domain-containing protein n=1 Tax=Vibrio cholerae TaxID=666 RepID=UPI00345E4844
MTPNSNTTTVTTAAQLKAENPEFAALQVPSTISPRDRNYVVNPNHPLMPEIFNKAEKLDFSFDQRIFK